MVVPEVLVGQLAKLIWVAFYVWLCLEQLVDVSLTEGSDHNLLEKSLRAGLVQFVQSHYFFSEVRG